MKKVSRVNSTTLGTVFSQLGRWQSITICLVICTALSCQQNEQEVILKNSPQLTTEDGILKFSSSDVYEKLLQTPKLLDNLLMKEDFQSFGEVNKPVSSTSKSARESGGENKKEAPETLAKLLNKDGVYQIGQWLIKLNFQTEKVFVLKDEHKKSLYDDLIAGRVSKKVWQFTFNDEVLDLLSNGYEGSPSPSAGAPGGRPAIFCGGGIAGDPDAGATDDPYYCTATSGRSSAYNRIEYSKYGTYFEVDLKWGGSTSRYRADGSGGTGPGGCEHVGTIDKKYFLETNCNNSWTRSDEAYGIQYTLPIEHYQGESESWNYQGRERIYQGSRGLRCLKVEFFNTRNAAGVNLSTQLIRGC